MSADPHTTDSSQLVPATVEQLASLLDQEKQIARLHTLQKISRELNSKLNMEDALASILDEAIRAVGAERGCLLLKNEATNKLELHLSRHLQLSDINGRPFRFSRTVIERVWREGQPVLTANAQEDPELTKADSVITQTLRSILCVPLHSLGRRIGVLYLDNRLKVGQFQEDELALLVAMADQAAIALRNAQLHAELQQQLAEMQSVLATTRAMVSEVSLNSLLEFIMAQAEHLTNAQGAAVLLACENGQSLEVAPSSESWLGMKAGTRLPVEGSLIGLAIDSQHVQVTNQAQDDDRTQPVRDLLQPIELRSLLCAPLVVQGESLGVLLVWNKQRETFTTHDDRLMGLFADQAALALHNAQLFQAAQQELAERKRVEGALLRHNRELELLNQASQAFNSTLHLNQVLATVLEGIRHLLDVTACSIWLIDPETEALVCRQAAGPNSEIVRGWRLALGEGLAGRVASSGEGRVVPDTQADERFSQNITRETGVEVRSILCVPLRAKRGVIGVVHVVDARANRFGSADLRWVEALAAAAASAIENAQLHARIRELAAEQERQRLARELHDTVTQSLYSIGMAAQTSRKLLRQADIDSRATDPIDHILALSQTTLAEMRERIYDLHPTSLADRGLIEALTQYCDTLRTQYLLLIEFKPDLERPLSMTRQEALYFIAREALWNVVKYAGATHVGVSLTVENNQAVLSVVDDGTGFDPSVFVREETMGLRNMKQRAELMGGTFELESRPGQGTRITARIPA
jgi:GAF domain-containing protein/anti-sigma regulatory factor (Ser/Thr protein kinase)